MRIVIVLMMVALLVVFTIPAFAVQIEISQETVDALVEIGIDDPAAHLKNKADKYIEEESDREWNKLTIEQKKEKLTVVEIEK